MTTGLVDSYNTIPLLMRTVRSGKLEPEQLLVHHFKLSEIMEAYDTFGNIRAGASFIPSLTIATTRSRFCISFTFAEALPNENHIQQTVYKANF